MTAEPNTRARWAWGGAIAAVLGSVGAWVATDAVQTVRTSPTRMSVAESQLLDLDRRVQRLESGAAIVMAPETRAAIDALKREIDLVRGIARERVMSEETRQLIRALDLRLERLEGSR